MLSLKNNKLCKHIQPIWYPGKSMQMNLDSQYWLSYEAVWEHYNLLNCVFTVLFAYPQVPLLQAGELMFKISSTAIVA